MLQTLPLSVNVSPLYDVLVTCALRLSDGDMFGGILKGFRARSKRLLGDLSCRQYSLLFCSSCPEFGSKIGLPMVRAPRTVMQSLQGTGLAQWTLLLGCEKDNGSSPYNKK